MAKAVTKRPAKRKIPRPRPIPRTGPLEIHWNMDGDGCVYALPMWEEERLHKVFPQAKGIPLVFLGCEDEAQWKELHFPYLPHVGRMLTGLTFDQLAHFGGFRLLDAVYDDLLWEWKPEAVKEAG